MAEERTSPYSAFNFSVEFDGREEGGFSEVTGLGTEITAAEYRNGNDRENHVRKIPNVHKTSDVTLKRGVLNAVDWKTWLTDIKTKGWVARKPMVVITLFDEAHEKVVEKWTLRNVFPTKYTGPSLNAKGGTDVAMEELVLAAEKIEFKM